MFNSIIAVLVVCLLLSCSKSDDNKDNYDPISAMEYSKLKSLDEINNMIFYYAGIKRGNEKASMLSNSSSSCRANEFFSVIITENQPNLNFGFIKFQSGNLGCETTDSVFFIDTELLSEGELFTTLVNGYLHPQIGLILGGRRFKGTLEIGFQGEYLRIEDYMSNYERIDPNEKVYLYFKK
ncbi:hypothetical protein [Myroides fluvii]|uniref:hypothetical protein n=1 Tax=Myroides fluvii TaxID=2572594 RepID=UPI00131CC4DF|nr:hypothetical protein [Myroides fluvii]